MRVGKANGGESLRLAEAAAILGVSRNTSADGATVAACRTTLAAADCDIVAVVDKRLHCLILVDADGVDKDTARESLDVAAFPAMALALRSGELVTVRDLDDPRLTDRERRDKRGWSYSSEVCVPLVSRTRSSASSISSTRALASTPLTGTACRASAVRLRRSWRRPCGHEEGPGGVAWRNPASRTRPPGPSLTPHRDRRAWSGWPLGDEERAEVVADCLVGGGELQRLQKSHKRLVICDHRGSKVLIPCEHRVHRLFFLFACHREPSPLLPAAL